MRGHFNLVFPLRPTKVSRRAIFALKQSSIAILQQRRPDVESVTNGLSRLSLRCPFEVDEDIEMIDVDVDVVMVDAPPLTTNGDVEMSEI